MGIRPIYIYDWRAIERSGEFDGGRKYANLDKGFEVIG